MPTNLPKPDIALLKSSTIEIFKDCLMPNGAIVAAPSHMPYYPKDAKSYLYCWPGRDTGFNLAAMLLLGYDYYENFLKWLWERAEDFGSSDKPQNLGLIYRSYFPNGLVREHEFQPDQGATLIWGIKFKKDLTKKPLTDLEQMVINRLANSYVRLWGDNGFVIPTEDIWEEGELLPGEGSFTYSVAACSKALQIAGELLDEKGFTQTADKMRNLVFTHNKSGLSRIFTASGKRTIDPDGSLMGLVWPFDIGFDKSQLTSTLLEIEDYLLDKDGVYRYLEDKYEGGGSRFHKGQKAGTWPLLTFWLSIAWKELGDTKRAERYFALVFRNLEDKYIPEQFFMNHPKKWRGVKPLLWSHSMAIFAAWKLGMLD